MPEGQDPRDLTTNSGLRRKIWTAFILQVAAISFATVLGIYGASTVLREVLVRQALAQEANYLWRRLAADPDATLPETYTLKAWRDVGGIQAEALPEALRPLPPGFHTVAGVAAGGGAFVHVSQREGLGRLYVALDQREIYRLALVYGAIPLALVLTIVYLIAWYTYRQSRRAISPVAWLAGVVESWDPKRPEPDDLKPERLPTGLDGEVAVLARSLHDLAERIEAFVARERFFTRDASHELRSPLTVIRIACDMLEAQEGLTQPARRSLHRIEAAARDMEAVVETFLVLAREDGVGFESDEFLINDLVEDEVRKARDLVADKPVELSIEERCRFVVTAPPRVVSVALANLLRNACIYTDRGSITVVIEDGSVSITDTGIGMSEEEARRAFDSDYRASPADRSGRGIGLPLVARLGHRFGWPIELHSSPEFGTRVSLVFPTYSRLEC
ncbi:MAG TPA: HAMP domain-containing sensor histidine kinase [Xanthomonadaceae bacterium]|nr:HAMP domain-containing sensor histidine kinase [Xanthomonadaceae bacterium]